MPTDVHLQLPKDVRIASPCPVRWEDMQGDDRVRHCDQCQLNVYNLSAMHEQEIRELLERKRSAPDQRVCAGYWARSDGTIMTRDCPVGLRAARVRVARAAGRLTAAIGVAVATAVCASALDRTLMRTGSGRLLGLRHLAPVRWVRAQLRPTPIITQAWIAGDIACPTASPAPAPPPAPAP